MTDHTTTPSASDSGLNLDHLEAQRDAIHFRFFKDICAPERLAVFKAFGVYPEDCTERLNHSIEHRLLDRILRRAAPVSAPVAGTDLTDDKILDLYFKAVEKSEKGELPSHESIIVHTVRAALANQPALARLTKNEIRAVFLANGFTVKEGQTDLKSYVYAAAEALLSRANQPAPTGDDRYSAGYSDGWREGRAEQTGNQDWIGDIVRDVAELPDRDSPIDQPDMMLVTAAELAALIERYAPANQPAPTAAPEQVASMEALRAKFEVHERASDLTREEEGYANPYVDSAWDGWQAAWKALQPSEAAPLNDASRDKAQMIADYLYKNTNLSGESAARAGKALWKLFSAAPSLPAAAPAPTVPAVDALRLAAEDAMGAIILKNYELAYEKLKNGLTSNRAAHQPAQEQAEPLTQLYESLSADDRAACDQARAELQAMPESEVVEMIRAGSQAAQYEAGDEAARLRKVLVDVRNSLQLANDSPGGGICDTLWMMDDAETVFDHIDAALAASPVVRATGRLYSYMGEHSEYELIGTAKGAGKCKLVEPVTVYRDTASGALYFRTAEDFAARMVPVVRAQSEESRPRRELPPGAKKAIAAAHATGSTVGQLPDSTPIFINYGHDYGDNAHLDCTACGGSGHIEDQQVRAAGAQQAHAGADEAQTAAARDVLAERQRQVEQEGWTPAHDDQYNEAELSRAAAAYTLQGDHDFGPPPEWPWKREWWKPRGERRNLVRAGALIIADIERLDRAAIRAAQEGGAA